MATAKKRVPISFDQRTAATLSYVALRLGTTKSRLVESFLAEPLEQLRALLFEFPDPLDQLSEEDKAALAARLSKSLQVEAGDALLMASEIQGERHD
jgi:hypothetical protein